ncbi:cadherin domain-containing protein [Candidatus Poriferisodalis sp.]|uniref:cadherin domain-containing protein n=1 Tax=Candidatus Poriferisodalis sp. TaxID=3101277 RepID=UPI003B5964C2
MGRAAGRHPAFLLVLIAALVLLLAGAPAQAQVSAPDTPTAPLTAEISDEPESHNGTDAFTFRVAFSENVAVSLAEFRDHTLKTTNGSIIGARRIGGRGDLWEITVQPDSDADVVVELPKTKDCNAQGAVCTAAGAKLSTRLELRVGGPRGQGQRERVYTFEDGDRTVRVILQGDLVVSETGAGTATDEVARRAARGNIVRRQFGQRAADLPVFRSASGGELMTLPGGVLLALDPEWDEAGVNGFFARNNIWKGRISELDYISNGFLVRTEPGFPSLELANALAAQKGVVVSSPNWWREVGTRQNPEEPEGDDRVAAQEDRGIEPRNEGFSDAWDLPLDSTYSGSIDPPGDYDFFKLDLSSQSGTTAVRIYTTGEFDTAGGLYSSDESLLKLNDNGTGTRNFSLQASLSPGVYYVTVFGAQYAYSASSTDIGNYTLHAETVTPTSVSLGSSVTPSIGAAGEEDYFEVDLSGQTGGTDVSLFTVSDDLMPLIKAPSGSLDALRTVDALGDGKWVVHWSDDNLVPGVYLFGVGSRDGDTGDYYLRAAAVPDHGSTTATATALSLDVPTSGTLTADNDTDYFELGFAAAKNLAILAFAHVNAVVLDSGGTEIPVYKEILAGGFNRIIDDFASGTYYVKITSDTYISDDSLVSNISQAAADTVAMSTSDYAQAFTTGAHAGGYTLSNVKVVSQDPEGESFTVALFTVDDDGHPNRYRALLTGPDNFAAGTLVFTARANITLKPNTTYALVFSRTFGSNANVSLGSTTSDGEDSDAAAGWSIANNYHLRHGGSEVWQETATHKSIRIAIEGPATANYALYAYEDTGYGTWVDDCADDTNDLDISTINDPLYACQWHLNSGDSGDMDINVESVWADSITGEGISVAVVDDTIDYSHDDLSDNINNSLNHDYGERGNAYRPADHHGTNIAGVIAARDNTIGVRGVTPRATIYGYNLLTDGHVHFTAANSADAMARNRVVTAVSNNSWGPPDAHFLNHAPAMWKMAIDSGVTEGYAGKGVFYVWAGGNGHLLQDNSNFDEFANYYGVTAVCAVSDAGIRSWYSEQGANLWVCAPSDGGNLGIVTTDNSDRYTNDFGGTSSATPKVSGVAALARHANPDLTWRDLKLILAASARQNDPTNAGWEEGARKYDSTDNSDRYHFNHEYGFGVVDAAAAVALARDWNTLPEFQNTSSASDVLNRTIPDNTDSGITSSLSLDTEIDFTEFVEVNVTIDHTYWRDLKIELESPAGTVSTLAVASPILAVVTPGTFRFGSAKHLGENPNGQWTLRVADVGKGDDGQLESWSIKVYGHRDNAVPSFSSPAMFTMAENQTAAGTVLAADSDAGDDVTGYAVSGGADRAFFSIGASSGTLTFDAAPNYEDAKDQGGNNSYVVVVQATSGTEERVKTTTQTITVTVTNRDEEGTVSLLPAQLRVRTVVRATLTDPDGDLSAVSWQWAESSDKTIWTNISGATQADYLPTETRRDKYLRAEASYGDGEGSNKTALMESNAVVGEREPGPVLSVKTLVTGLRYPWGIAFTPDGTMLFTERDGHRQQDPLPDPLQGLSSLRTDGTLRTVSADFSDLDTDENGGVMGLEVDPDFVDNRRIYICQQQTGSVIQVVAWTIDATYTTATRVNDPLVGDIPREENHNGCRLRFGPDGNLWISTGDTEAIGTVPQDLNSLGGKILRVDPLTGAAPADNPFSGSLVYSYGHRNPQGLALRPGTRQMWAVGHGPAVDDEINLLRAGANYGWDPVPTDEDGDPTSGYDDTVPMTDLVKFPGAVEAKWSSGNPTLATSGGIFLEGEQWGLWEGRLAVATLKGRSLRIFEFTEDGTFVSHVVPEELDHFGDRDHRLRTPMIGPDNALYLSTSTRGWRDEILRVTPEQAPEFPNDAETRQVIENTGGDMVVATVEATDYNHDELTYTLGDTDGELFYILDENVGELRVKSTTQLDYETRQAYVVTVTATDPQGLSDSTTLTISVTDMDEAPGKPGVPAVSAVSVTSLSVGWSAPANAGPAITDYDVQYRAGISGAWSDAGHAGTAVTATLAGLSENTSYQVQVRAKNAEGTGSWSDSGSGRTDANAAPVFSSSATFSAAENQTEVAMVLAADSDSEDKIERYDITGGADQSFFLVIASSGHLEFRNGPNYEDPRDQRANNTYVVEVTATSGTGTREKTATQTITVTVTDVNTEAPGKPGAPAVSTASVTSLSVGWSAPANAGPAITDYDMRYRAGISGAWSDAGHVGTAVTATLAGLSENTSYQVQVRAKNAEGTGSWSDSGSGRTDANAAPSFSSPATFAMTENRTSVGTVRAADSDTGDSIEGYAIGGGADRALFSIGATSGALTFKTAPNYEDPEDQGANNSYVVEVQGTSGTGTREKTATQTITVTVTDVNEGPEISRVGSAPGSVPENQDQSQVLARYTATDPENPSAETTRWSTSGSDGGDFAINEQGELRFKSTPDYERPADSNRDNVYVFTVRVSDGRNYGSLEETVTVTPVNEPPAITTVGSSATALRQPENRVSRLYSYRAADPEGADTVTWSVAGSDGGLFAIDQSGQFSFKADSAPDYERPADSNRDNVYNVTVQATDDDNNTAPLDVTVTVTDVNEGPEVTSGSPSFTIEENQGLPNAVYAGFDPEGGTVTRWTVGGRDGGDFAITQDGVLTFRSLPDYERPADSDRDNTYELEVRPYDGRYYGSFDVTVTVTDVNEPPTITTVGSSATALRQPENRVSRLYSYRAADPEGADTVTWSVAGSDGGLFAIDQSGQFSFKADSAPDYERPADSNRDNVYNVTVQATDDDNNTAPLDVTVTVTDVNEGPEISRVGSAPGSVPENQDQSQVLARYTATDPENPSAETTRWSTSGSDGGDFAINEQGELRFKSTPDYERPADSNRDNVYVFTVRVSDGRNYGSLEETVTVTPVNEPPAITTVGSSATALRQPENRVSRLYSYRAADPEGADTVTWSVAGSDGGLFAIDQSGQFSFKADSAPDYERPADSNRDNVYNVTVQATDDDNNTAPLDVTVTVTDVNEGPEVSGPSSFAIAENGSLSGAVYAATDPEGLNVARWSVGGRDGGDFFITQGGTLYFRSVPDYERPADSDRDNTYEVTIQPSDGRNNGSYPVIVAVTDVNEPPEIRGGSKTSFMQQENRTSRLYTYSATDPEGGTVRWSVAGPDGGRFAIDEKGQFSFKQDSPPDFDKPSDVGADNVYDVTVQATDAESNTASLPVTVTVTEVNEGPVISRQSSAPGTVPENQAVTQVLATYTASDPERPGVTITQWSATGRDGGDFVMNALGQLMFRNPPDFERPADSDRDNVYEVTIRASDGRNTSTMEEVQTVTVTDVNEPPTITTTSRTAFTLQEGRTSTLYTFRATDPEGETVNWTTGGTDGSAFTIDERGALFFTNPPDFESPTDSDGDNVYNVTVQARDTVPNTAGLDIVVTVTDQNEGVEPTITTRRPPATYRENGTSAVYTFRASDPQRGTVITWTLEGTDWEDFTITAGSTGRGVLSFDSPPDFEKPTDADRDNIYGLAVVATDDDGHTDRVDFTVTVTDDNEGVEPTITTRRPPATYRENDTRTVYTFRATDPQRDTVTWSLSGADSEDFTITADNSGRRVLAFNSPPDFESPADADQDNTYELAVVATDGDGHTDQVDFAITVTDVNEGPRISLEGTATTAVAENTPDTVVLADYTARDPENPGVGIFRWSTTGRDSGDFVISDLGELRFRSSPDYERPADSNRDNVYEVTVRASDGRSYGMLEIPLEVTVTQVNEAPVITTTSRTEFSLRENSTSVIYTYRATDQDTGDAIRWSLEGADGGDFAIYNGMVTFRLLPDLENPVDDDADNVYEITVVAADSAGLRDTVNAVITITDQSEGPVIAGTTSYTVAENYDIAQVLGSYTATDAKDNRPVHPRWSLSGRDGGDFTINKRGELTFRSIPDYDRPADSNRDNVYEVAVRGHDSRAYGNLNVTVRVTPVNEHDPVVTGRETLSFRENTPVTTRLNTYRATDEDRDTSFTWSVEGDDQDDFAIDEGVLTFSRPPDYEQPGDRDTDNVYEVTVVASDGANRGTLDVTVTVTEQNEGPVVSGTAEFTVTENRDLPNAVYTAQDPEAVGGVTTAITWRLSGRDGGDFTINRETGVLTFRTPPDHERPADSGRDNVYEVTVRAHDGRNYGDFKVTVTVDDVAEITGPAVISQEESFEGVLATYSAAGQGTLSVVPSWRLSGTDSGDFVIDRETGVLTFRTPPDHERPADSNRDNVYSFAVQVSDGSYHSTLDVTVTVTAVNEPPAVTGRDSLRFRENTPVTTRLSTYRATDPERDAFAWGLVGPDADDFAITTDSSGRGVLTFSSPPNFDSPAGSGADANQYLVTVQAQDGQGATGELRVTVTVTDQNEGAVVTGQQTIAVQENRDPALALATYRAADPEGQAITRWGLSGSDRGDFLISETGVLTFRNTPDYDRPADSGRDNEYRVTVRAYDGRTYGSLDVAITVSNVNEHDPVIRSGSRTSFTYREEGTSVLYTYRATDQDKDDVINWTTAGSDGSLFEFDARNGLVFLEPPDFENPGDSGADNVYELTVAATDSGGRSASLPVTVTVTELNEGPKVSGTATYAVPEGQDLAGAIFTARDPEDTGAAVTSWRLAGSDAGDFEITATGQNSAQLTFRNTPDYDRPADSGRNNEYLVTIRAYNGSTYGSLEVTVTVTDHNEAEPVVTGRDALSFRENTPVTTRLYTYRATDTDLGATIAWSVGGADGEDFTISTGGELFFSSIPDHEEAADADADNVYEIAVVASDGPHEGALAVTVTVTGVNEGPEIAGTRSLVFDENTATDRVLATYTGTDPEDPTAEVTRWSVTGRDGGDFSINEDGELTFRNPPDHERPADSGRDNTYEVTVRASDGRVYGNLDVVVNVEAVDEAPEFRRGSRDSFSYRENGTASLYTYRAADPEGAEVEWSVGGVDGDDFTISDSGVLTFTEPPDHDDPADDDQDSEYQVTVVATDQTGHAADLPLTVTVTDANEGPVIADTGANTDITVQENHDQVLAAYTATDPEDQPVTRWSVTGRDGGDFSINEDGELTFRNPPDHERPADSGRDNTYEVTVRASDGRVYGNLDVVVNVEAVDEAPEISGDDAVGYKENGTASVATYRATDPEGHGVTWGLSGTDSNAFTMSETGVLSFNSPPDYENPADSERDNVYLVTVEAKDDQSITARLAVTVTVINVTDRGAPSGLEVTRHQSGQLKVSWNAPDSGPAPTGYIVQWKRHGADWTDEDDVSQTPVTDTSHIIEGLTDGVKYDIRVIASTDETDSAPSQEGTATPGETTPPGP